MINQRVTFVRFRSQLRMTGVIVEQKHDNHTGRLYYKIKGDDGISYFRYPDEIRTDDKVRVQ